MILQRYTNPADVSQQDVDNISAAKSTLDIAAYTLTHQGIITAVDGRARAGVKVRLYLDRTELECEARGDATLAHCPLGVLLSTPNVQIKVKASSILMHLKSYCVDNKLLRDGSANFSPLGEGEQDNSMFCNDDSGVLAVWQCKFEAMWARQDNLSVAQAISESHRTEPTRYNSR